MEVKPMILNHCSLLMAVHLNMAFHTIRQRGHDITLMVLMIGLWPTAICEGNLCPDDEVIDGGWIKWPENRVERSVMTYICPVGFRPHPVSWRCCGSDGKWSRLRNAYGEVALRASCKELTCLAPQYFEFGSFHPRRVVHRFNDSISFQCYDGFQLVGPALRTCLPNGQWTGKLPRCYTEGTLCPNPGIPFGSKRTGNRFNLFSIVLYSCWTSILRGSSKRQCLQSGQWSGVEPRCENRYAFDNVKDLARELDILESTVRTNDLTLGPNDKKRVDFFFVVDISASLGNENFIKAFDFVTTFINRFSDFNDVVRFEVIAFGPDVITITHIKDHLTPGRMIEKIKGLKYGDYNINRGRTTGYALEKVYSTINDTLHIWTWNRRPVPKQVIMIITNGPFNGASSPYSVMKKISNSLSHLSDRLDVYAIGIGGIKKDILENLVPVKETLAHGQQYAFYFPTYDYLEEAQEKLKMNSKFDCGVRGNLIQGPVGRIFGGVQSREYDWPWQVSIQLPKSVQEFCGGSIISARWILSAAHCFNETMGMISNITIRVGSIRRMDSLQTLTLEEVILHDDFNRPTEMNNDIALLKVKETITYSSHVRPVCLPCTKRSAQLLSSPGGNWNEACQSEAIRLTGDGGRKATKLSGYVTGWGYHRKASRISSIDLLHAQINIENRLACDSPFPLTETMFCARGEKTDSCQGDSGGPFVLERNHRWIQIGIVSFGKSTTCGQDIMGIYSSVPKLMSWIKERVTDVEYE
ncbi:complement factor B-like [Leucoraja erinacea]|uniref:complement factor B-like n=1 Tax=Leucoraja erinaceus TaxID=7782 RepID=UPI0024579C47|nr:complement factor B-like [Leucoraja erinacea]